MSTKVTVCNVEVQNQERAKFTDPFTLNITFEAHEALPHDLEWKLTYVGSADNEANDQQLDSVLVGPVPEGRHQFTFETKAPDAEQIPASEIVGVTVLLLTCSYKDQLFSKIGWYLSNDYEDDPELKDNPPAKPQIDKLVRTIFTTDVRVTTYAIRWDEDEATTAPLDQEDQQMIETPGEEGGEEDSMPPLTNEDGTPVGQPTGNNDKTEENNSKETQQEKLQATEAADDTTDSATTILNDLTNNSNKSATAGEVSS